MKTHDAPAFYALNAGGNWKGYVNLLHFPYTLWHLSYVVLGAALAPTIYLDRLAGTLLAFFLAVGIASHALDELNGRPLGTRIPREILIAMAVVSLTGAMALGIVAGVSGAIWVLPLAVFGGFIVVSYNLGLWNGRFHSDFWFALAWGAFPAVTAYWIHSATINIPVGLLAIGCFTLSLAQRTLSKEVRNVRRRTIKVDGTMEMIDGRTTKLDRTSIIAAPERALVLLSLTVVLLAGGLLASRY